jgi:hypothetical protein
VVQRSQCSKAFVAQPRDQQLQAVCYSCEYEIKPGQVCIELSCKHLIHSWCLYSSWKSSGDAQVPDRDRVCYQCDAATVHPYIVTHRVAISVGNLQAVCDYASSFAVRSHVLKRFL